MDSKLTSRIPARIVVNGKSYSPVCTPGSEEDITKLCFSLFQRTASAIQKPGIELRVFAVRAVKGGDSQKSQYHANLLFPADAIINYSHTTPSKVSDIDRAFNNVGEIDLHLWRCLNFSAKEVIIETGPGGVPSLYSERTEVEFARLMNTAKNVNAIPNAVLEVSCLISIHSHDLTDARDTRVANMERAVFLTPPEPSSGKVTPTTSSFDKASPGPSPSKTSSQRESKTYLTLESLTSKFKPKHEASYPSSTASTCRDDDSPAKTSSSFDETKPPTKTKHRKSISAPHPKNVGSWRAGVREGNMFQGITPPKALDADAEKHKEKSFCFNCKAAGHRELDCTTSKDIANNPFCINCRKKGHTRWLCLEPKAKGV